MVGRWPRGGGGAKEEVGGSEDDITGNISLAMSSGTKAAATDKQQRAYV